MAKTKQFTCTDCGKKFDYEPIEGYPWAHPTTCDPCIDKRREKEKEAERERDRARRDAEIARLPYTEWDCAVGNNALRNTVGRTIFEDGKPTSKSLWVQGPVGCGKTRTVCFVGKVLTERGGHVRYEQCVKILGSYAKEFMNGDAESYAKQLGSDRRILILDDYGVGKLTERGAELLYLIADERLIRVLPTWITSNLMPEGIAGWFPDNNTMQDYARRITRRITESFTIIKA